MNIELEKTEQELKKITSLKSRASSFLKSVVSTVGWTALIGIILAAIGALVDWVRTLNTAASAQRKLNKAIKEGTAQIASEGVVILKELAYAYQKAGDTAEEKQKFLEQYKDKIAETGIAIDTVEKAEDVFVKNTDKYVEALMARAKAQAIENKAIELYEQYLTKKATLEKRVENRRRDSFWNFFGEARAENAEKNIAKEKAKIDETLTTLFKDVADLNTEWNGL